MWFVNTSVSPESAVAPNAALAKSPQPGGDLIELERRPLTIQGATSPSIVYLAKSSVRFDSDNNIVYLKAIRIASMPGFSVKQIESEWRTDCAGQFAKYVRSSMLYANGTPAELKPNLTQQFKPAYGFDIVCQGGRPSPDVLAATPGVTFPQ